MIIPLRQSTSRVVPVGRLVDATDCITPETGLATALNHASTGLKIQKNGGAYAVRNGTPTASVHRHEGFYDVTFNATDSDTLGFLKASFTDAACLPWDGTFYVWPQQVFDSLFAGTDLLDVEPSSASITAIRNGLALTSDVNTVGTAVAAIPLNVLRAVTGNNLWKIVENGNAIEIRLKSDNSLLYTANRVRSTDPLNAVTTIGA